MVCLAHAQEERAGCLQEVIEAVALILRCHQWQLMRVASFYNMYDLPVKAIQNYSLY